MFHIQTYPRLKLLRGKLTGFLTLEEFTAYVATAHQSVAEMGCNSGDWFHACDISGMMLQSQTVAEACSKFLNHPAQRSRRLALITGTSPVRMQVRRLMTRSDAAIFETPREADLWLLAPFDQRLSASAA